MNSAFVELLGIEWDCVDATLARGTMTVDERHHTPWGIVHGGVYAAAVETAATLGACAAVEDRGQFAVGVDNVTDFLRPVVSARLTVLARAEQVGRTLQLWRVDITDERGRTIACGRVRLANQALPQG